MSKPVYVVQNESGYGDEGSFILGVFSSKELAEAYVAKHPSNCSGLYDTKVLAFKLDTDEPGRYV